MYRLDLIFLLLILILASPAKGQYRWTNINEQYGPLPASFHVYRCTDSIEGLPSIAYHARVRLKDRKIRFTTDSTLGRRLTPAQYFQRNASPLLVVNGTFFDPRSRNLNVLIRDGKLISFNEMLIPGRNDSVHKVTRGAIGITGKRKADVGWIYTDSSGYAKAFQTIPRKWYDTVRHPDLKQFETSNGTKARTWKVQTAIGGGPVLVQDGKLAISNDEERMFTGKGRDDRHPRTAMGYTYSGDLIILVVEGRNKGIAEGASLIHLAKMLIELGCKEAVNLDGGGSSCMLINGKETIRPSDATGQRPVPGVFIVSGK